MLMTMNSRIRDTANRAVEEQKLTQKQLGERAGMSQPAVGRILNGDRKGDPDSWQRILDALGLELVAVPKGTSVHEHQEEPTIKSDPPREPTVALPEAPRREVKAPTKGSEIPPEVEELRRRWKGGEFKSKGFTTPNGTYSASELQWRFSLLKSGRPGSKKALSELIEIATAVIESEPSPPDAAELPSPQTTRARP